MTYITTQNRKNYKKFSGLRFPCNVLSVVTPLLFNICSILSQISDSSNVWCIQQLNSELEFMQKEHKTKNLKSLVQPSLQFPFYRQCLPPNTGKSRLESKNSLKALTCERIVLAVSFMRFLKRGRLTKETMDFICEKILYKLLFMFALK